jgi:general secretion pathway protein G
MVTTLLRPPQDRSLVNPPLAFAHPKGGGIHGFTLIELLVVLAIIAMLLSIVAPTYFVSVDRSKETVLQQNLRTMRDAIDKYYGDREKYPDALDDLVTKKYLRAIPPDPITESATTWVVIPPEDSELGGVYDVKSGAQGKTQDGTPYAEL